MNKHKKKTWFRRYLIPALILILLAAVVIGGIIWYRHDHDVSINKKGTAINTNGSSTKKSTVGATAPSTTNSSTSSESSASTTTSTSSSTASSTPNASPPEAPNGTFVSNHTPGQNGSPQAESSVCNVSPGVSCTISFTMGDKTISLLSQTAGNSGSVSWSWTPAQINLTSGSWSIAATASLNGLSSTTRDPILLKVE